MSDFEELIKNLKQGRDFDSELTDKFIIFLSSPQSSAIELAALTAAWKAKGEKAEELALIAQNILNKIPQISVQGQVADCCGTGGDGLNSFNISTTSAFLAAGLGLKMAKHGGRKTTSASGSIDFLEALKIPYFIDSEQIKKQLDKKGLVFISSPALHQVLGNWKAICRKIGFSGQTGLIGTLTNPVSITHQMLGVPKREWGILMIEALRLLGREKAIVIHGFPNFDEASLCGETQIWLLENNKISEFSINPSDFDLPICQIEDLKGGLPEENAQIFFNILNNNAKPALINTVCLNTALLLWLCNKVSNIKQGIHQTQEFISSGLALAFWNDFLKE